MNLYRTPRDPGGFPFGYDWRATATGLIELLQFDDLENAGAIWVDAPVVVDGNLISSRTPLDLVPFAKTFADALQK